MNNKSSFIINLTGLSTGLACAILIYLWVNNELSTDKFHQKDKRLYQVMQNMKMPDGIVTFEYTPFLLAQTLADGIPETEYAISVIPELPIATAGILSYNNIKLKTNEYFVSKEFFQVFSYKVIEGNINNVLADRNSILISNKYAKQFFGSTKNAIGKILNWERKILNNEFSGVYKVAGVFEQPPANSSQQFDLLLNYELFCDKWGWNNINDWTNNFPYTYVVLKEGSNVEQFNKKIATIIKSKYENNKRTFFVRPYSDKYLYNNYENGSLTGGRITYIRLFSLISIFIIVIACINFMNMSTAKASGRLKEIGIRKTVGASRKNLAVQYLKESLIMAFLSLIIAIVLVSLLLPQFNLITGKHLDLVVDAKIIFTILMITLITGLIAGSYPALYLSGFNPINVLKGRILSTVYEVWIRKGLVIFQFTISVVLIVLTTVVYKQIEFIQNKKLGFNKNNIVCFTRDKTLEKSFDAFLYEVKNIPGVLNASNSSNNFTGTFSSTTGNVTYQKNNKLHFACMDINYDFFKTLGIVIKEGRNFSKEYVSDTTSIILNESAVKSLCIKDPIGKTLSIWGENRQIIGVVNDFHFESLYEKVKPAFFQLVNPKSNMANNIWIKLLAGKERETILRIQALYNKFNPGLDLDYKYLNADIENLYLAENRVVALSRYFAGIAIIISCMGIFGLAAFMVQKRRKEIGIRKVLGASVSNVAFIFSKNFLILVAVSNVIAWPAAYYFMNNWLQDFAYRIEIDLWIFVLSGSIALLIALLTVSFQAIKAATANPIESLRYE